MGSLCSGTDHPAEGLPREPSSPRVQLRVPTDEDAFAWHRVFDDPEVMEFHGGRPAELSVYEELTARQRRHDAERGFCLWTMLDEDGEVIGFTGAQPWPQTGVRRARSRSAGGSGGRTGARGTSTAAAQATLERVGRRAYRAWWPWSTPATSARSR